MSQLAHRIYIGSLVGIVVLTTIFLLVKGMPYYSTGLEERFYHPDHDNLKSSGIAGHGLGIVGTLLIVIGVFGYIVRKRNRSLARLGRLKYWLEFHIFLCSLGPILILFHTTFKFGGIASVSFWSMAAVVASGILGRFIYLQIPRTIEGEALSLNEVQDMKAGLRATLETSHVLDKVSYSALVGASAMTGSGREKNLLTRIFREYFEERKVIRKVKNTLRENKVSKSDVKRITRIIKNERTLSNRIERLQFMQNLFSYWHVAHLPFAIIMLIFLLIHVGVALAFGYRWIF